MAIFRKHWNEVSHVEGIQRHEGVHDKLYSLESSDNINCHM